MDQTNARIPASGGTCDEDGLDLRFESVRGRLKLKRNAAGNLIGTWQQGPTQSVTFMRLANGHEPVASLQLPFGRFQEEVDKACSINGAPALGAAFIAKRGADINAQEAIAGVLVTGEAAPVFLAQKWLWAQLLSR